jgi:hypothetical protein
LKEKGASTGGAFVIYMKLMPSGMPFFQFKTPKINIQKKTKGA